MRLNLKNVQSLTVPAGRSEILVFDDDLRGFGLRILPSGTRTWFVQYRAPGGQRRHKLGRFPPVTPEAARREAEKKLALVQLGNDPELQKKQAREDAKNTLGVIADKYLTDAKMRLRPRGYAEVERHLTKHWRPLRGEPISRIERRAVASRLEEIAEESGVIASNRARSSLSMLFTWAMKRGLAWTNPVIGCAKIGQEISREHVITDAELAAIWRSCRDDDHGRIVRLLILTGQRREEVGGLRWSELDLDKAQWILPAERAKNKRPQLVPLSEPALAILDSVIRRPGRDHLFGEGESSFSGWSRAKANLDKRIADAARQGGTDVRPWRLHDTRRTMSTAMGDHLGVLPHVADAVLGHVGTSQSGKKGVAGVYNKSLYLAEKRQALALWGARVMSLVAGTSENVIPLMRAG